MNQRPTVLIVDDIEMNRIILREILGDGYLIEEAEDGFEAISILVNASEKPNIVLLDIMMPGMDGFQTLKFMKEDPLLQRIPVMFITSADQEVQGLKAGAVDYICKPFEPEIVKLRVATHIELALYRDKLEMLVEQKAHELVVMKDNFIDIMANIIEYRSLESGTHVRRTKALTKLLIAQLLKTNRYKQELIDLNYEAIIKAVPLHDIGKIAIPDHILLKPGKLTDEEFKVIETHTSVGGNIIKQMMKDSPNDEYLQHCYDICMFHHERWNGLGYPQRLAGEKIPLSARIVSVVDIYDALTSERCYKAAYTHSEAMAILKSMVGTNLDPIVMEALCEADEIFSDWSED